MQIRRPQEYLFRRVILALPSDAISVTVALRTCRAEHTWAREVKETMAPNDEATCTNAKLGTEWGILTPYHEGDWIFSAPQAGLLSLEGRLDAARGR